MHTSDERLFTYQLQEEILEAYREIVYNKIPAKISRLFHGSERCRQVQYVHIRLLSVVLRACQSAAYEKGQKKSVCRKRNWRMPDQNWNYIGLLYSKICFRLISYFAQFAPCSDTLQVCFSATVFSVLSQDIVLEERLQNDRFCVECRDVKPELSQSIQLRSRDWFSQRFFHFSVRRVYFSYCDRKQWPMTLTFETDSAKMSHHATCHFVWKLSSDTHTHNRPIAVPGPLK